MATRSAATVLQAIWSLANTDGGEVSDRDLLHRFVFANDQAAFAALVRRHAGMVLGVCRRALPTLQDAEDACQATFLVLAQKAKGNRWQPSIANWLFATARKVARNARVAAQRRARREARAAVPEAVVPVDQMTGPELLAALDEELDKLPPRYREPLVLCYLEGLTRDEAAARLSVPAATLKIRLERGRKRLGAALSKRGCALGIGLLALAATSPAGASPSRLVASVLAAGSGSCPAAVAALAKGVTVNGLMTKSLLLVLALAGTAALGIGLGAVSLSVAGQQPTPARPAQSESPAAMKDKPKAQRKAGPSAQVKQEADNPVPVAGQVVGPDGQPVAGANLTVINDALAAPAPQRQTGPDGRFAFRLPRPPQRGPWHVVASAPGHGVDWVAVSAAPQLTLRLVPDLPIAGRVIDLQGKPVAGATVAVDNIHTGPLGAFDELLKNWKKSAREQGETADKLDRSLWNRGALGKAFHATTATDGTFTLAGFGKDRVVTLLVTGSGIADTYAAVATRTGFDPRGAPRTPLHLYPPSFTLTAAPDKPVTGVVLDATSKAPLAGVRVTGTALIDDLPQGRYNFHAWPTPATTTDQAGRFTLRGMAKARAYILVADPEEGTEHLHRFAQVPDTFGFAAIPTTIELPRGVVVTGRVTDARTGAGVPCRVFYRPLEKNELGGRFPGYDPPDLPAPWHRGRDLFTDADGRYKLTVMPGAGVVHIQANNRSVYETAGATRQDIEDGIVDEKMGWFRTVGQGGHYNPEYMNAFKVISPAASERTMTLDVTLRRAAPAAR
jgi:RNA polymerase sigma factor (sigma-70 family)